ncbi:alpha/beta hydrolase [Candidatus Woesearchaeota archaeon]|nr:alpha/beta hydrolase [Candidatus Woesearchaeota archaeon]
MKRVFILHGWGDYYNKGWFKWLERELIDIGFSAKALDMKPQPPILNKWVDLLKKAVKTVDKDTYFVGHSAGVQTILHYLQNLPSGIKAGGVVMVAGWNDDLGMNELKNFFKNNLNWNKIKSHCNNFISIRSNDDPYVKPYHAKIFKEKLGATLILEKGKKHFSFEDGINKLPIVLKAVLGLAK